MADPMSMGAIALSAAGAVVGVEVIKKLVMDQIFPPKDFNPKDRELLKEIHSDVKEIKEMTKASCLKVKDLYDLHNVKDQDGNPLVYAPRSWGKNQEDTLNVTKEIAFSQKEAANALENVAKIIEKLYDKIVQMDSNGS